MQKNQIEDFYNFKGFSSIAPMKNLKGYGLQVTKSTNNKICFLAAKQKTDRTQTENATFFWGDKKNSLRVTLKNSEIGDILNLIYLTKDKKYLKRIIDEEGPQKEVFKHISSSDPKEIEIEVSLYNEKPQLSILISRKVSKENLMIPIRLKGGELKELEQILENHLKTTLDFSCFMPVGLYCSKLEINKVMLLPKMNIGEKIKTVIFKDEKKVITLLIKDIVFNTSKNIFIYVCEENERGK